MIEDRGAVLPGTAPIVFMRTAFAHLYFWHDGWAYSLDVQTGGVSQVTQAIDVLFTVLTRPRMKEKILRVELFDQARARLGTLTHNECYAFEPSLALGGPATARPERDGVARRITPESERALTSVILDPTEDEDMIDAAEESLAESWAQTRRFDRGVPRTSPMWRRSIG